MSAEGSTSSGRRAAGSRWGHPTLALVESPAQLLNVLEWALGSGRAAVPDATAALNAATLNAASANAATPVDPDELGIAVLLPRDPATRAQLRTMSGLAREEGLAVAEFEARAGLWSRAGAGTRLAAQLLRARRLVLGDPFSRLVQTLLPSAARAREFVVVDDGTATMEFAALLSAGRPLVRWHSTGGRPAASAVRTARRLAPRAGTAPGHRLEVFSSLPLPSALANLPGVSTTVNQYAWTTGRFGPPRVIDSADLVGSSLVETGVVDAEPYLRKVAELVRDHGVQRYFAHRRESADKLEVLRERTGVRVVRPSLPLELYARSGPVGRTVLSFPSTLVHTLPLVLAGTGVRVLVGEVEADWLSRAHASGGRAAGFLAEVTATARRRHGLDLLPRTAAAA